MSLSRFPFWLYKHLVFKQKRISNHHFKMLSTLLFIRLLLILPIIKMQTQTVVTFLILIKKRYFYYQPQQYCRQISKIMISEYLSVLIMNSIHKIKDTKNHFICCKVHDFHIQIKQINIQKNSQPLEQKIKNKLIPTNRNHLWLEVEDPAAGQANFDQRPEIKRSVSSQLMRCSSATSKPFTDRTVKTSIIKQKKAEFQQKFKVAFRYVLDNNGASLNEKRRTCNQKTRPKDQIFRVNRSTLAITNHDEYNGKQNYLRLTIWARNLRIANNFGPKKVCSNSALNQFHNRRQGPKADLAQQANDSNFRSHLWSYTSIYQYSELFSELWIILIDDHYCNLQQTLNVIVSIVLIELFSKKTR